MHLRSCEFPSICPDPLKTNLTLNKKFIVQSMSIILICTHTFMFKAVQRHSETNMTSLRSYDKRAPRSRHLGRKQAERSCTLSRPSRTCITSIRYTRNLSVAGPKSPQLLLSELYAIAVHRLSICCHRPGC